MLIYSHKKDDNDATSFCCVILARGEKGVISIILKWLKQKSKRTDTNDVTRQQQTQRSHMSILAR
jgi:hypothetical protein